MSLLSFANRCSLFVIVGLAQATDVAAQSRSPVEPGQRVRVTTATGESWLIGTVIVAEDSAFVVRSRRDARVIVPLDGVRTIELSVNRERWGKAYSRGASDGLLVGLTVGIVATTLTYLSDADERVRDDEAHIPPTVVVGVLSAMFVPVSTVVGGFIGVGTRREQWRPLQLPARVGIAPNRSGGVRAVVRIGF